MDSSIVQNPAAVQDVTRWETNHRCAAPPCNKRPPTQYIVTPAGETDLLSVRCGCGQTYTSPESIGHNDPGFLERLTDPETRKEIEEWLRDHTCAHTWTPKQSRTPFEDGNYASIVHQMTGERPTSYVITPTAIADLVAVECCCQERLDPKGQYAHI